MQIRYHNGVGNGEQPAHLQSECQLSGRVGHPAEENLKVLLDEGRAVYYFRLWHENRVKSKVTARGECNDYW